MKVLVFTRHTPLPWEDGAGAYLFDLLSFLEEQGFEIHVAWLAPHDHLRWKGIWVLPQKIGNVLTMHLPGAVGNGRCILFPDIYWLPFKARTLNRIKSVLAAIGCMPRRPPCASPKKSASATSAPRPWMATPSPVESEFAGEVARKVRPDIVIANYAWMMPLAENYPVRATRICLQHDVAWRRAEMQADVMGGAVEITKSVEAELLGHADIIGAISESDSIEFRNMVPNSDVVVMPKACRPMPLPDPGNQRLLFVGSNNAFNVEGLSWFLKEVWPLIRSAVPGAELEICGSIADGVTERYDGVEMCGPLLDLAPAYARSAVAIVPLLRASGMNIKLVDAACHGRAIVTTPVTLQGAPFLEDAAASAEGSAEFAAAVIRLLREPAARAVAGRRALDAVTGHLSPDNCYSGLVDKLASGKSIRSAGYSKSRCLLASVL